MESNSGRPASEEMIFVEVLVIIGVLVIELAVILIFW